MFVGRVTRKLDAKGRLALPAEYLGKLEREDRDEVVLAPGPRGCIWLLPKSYWGTVSERLANSFSSPIPGEFYHHCQFRGLDQSGRVLLDEDARKLAGIPSAKEAAQAAEKARACGADPKSEEGDGAVRVTVCGTGRYIQIWFKPRYEETALSAESFAERLAAHTGAATVRSGSE